MSAEKICPTCGTEYPANERFCPRDGTALRSQAGGSDLVGSIIAERYHVLRKLGEGGMGQVYLAEHVKMGRKSAVKVMNPGMVHDADAISRFNREAANASRINHPNVAGIYDFGETSDGLIYLAMEFIEGDSLTAVVERAGALAPARAAEITLQAANALAVAHDMGIVHRDLKPDNIMIARNRDGSDCVKVVDFGIAKAAGAENQKVTKTGLVIGTPEYMSPEQLAGDKLDGRSDVYSLALVAFNMLTGKLPFPSDTVQESMIMRLTDSPKRLAEMKPDVAWSDEVQRVMTRALSRPVNERYQNAAEFGRELWQAVERMPSTAAATDRTAVMGAADAGATLAMPATRVAPAVANSAAGAVAAPVSAPVAPVASAKRRMPLMAAAAVVLAAGIGGTMMMSKGDTVAPRTETAAVDSAGTAGPEVQQTPAPGAVTPLSRPLQVPAGGGSDVRPSIPAGGAAAASPSLAPELDRLLPMSADEASAQRVLDELLQLSARISAAPPAERALAGLIRGQALGMLSRDDASCAALREAAPLAGAGSRTRAKIDGLIAASCS